jgi:hypothetical protein
MKKNFISKKWETKEKNDDNDMYMFLYLGFLNENRKVQKFAFDG